MKGLFNILTIPLAAVWYLVARLRDWLFDKGWLKSHTFPLPIICVGNLAVGGTGKTPHVEYLLRLLHQEGYRVAMLSRGYGRKTKGYILADPMHHTATDIGDEPFQMMHNCPFATIAVCEKRVVGIQRLLKLQPAIDVIVLDDAFQHRYVKAGYNLLLTDAHRLYTHDHLLPWGRLREPSCAAHRAQAIIVTKCESNQRPTIDIADNQQLFYSRIVYGELLTPDMQAMPHLSLEGQRILLIAGIANPTPLVQYLEGKGAAVEVVAFADHHAFTTKDVARINRLWQEKQCNLALTTQKDMTRLLPWLSHFDEPLASNLLVQPITVRIASATDTNNKESFNQTILQYVRTNQRNRSVD